MGSNVVNDHGKLAVLLVGLVGGLALVMTNHESGGLIVSAIIGYITGNGVLAVRRQAPSPMLTINPPDDTVKVADLEALKTAADQAAADQAATAAAGAGVVVVVPPATIPTLGATQGAPTATAQSPAPPSWGPNP